MSRFDSSLAIGDVSVPFAPFDPVIAIEWALDQVPLSNRSLLVDALPRNMHLQCFGGRVSPDELEQSTSYR